jgi:hypothetical protein
VHVSDDVKQPGLDPHGDDFEAHGLKEGVAVALGAGALAVSGAAQAYVPAPPGSEGRAGTSAPKPLAKKAAKKKAKAISVSGGKTSPKKPFLQPDA